MAKAESTKNEIAATGFFDEVVRESDALQYVLGKVEQVAPLDATVLIEGETGVGKELFARAIHRRSPRGRRPRLKVNCTALPEMIEDELFGEQRGASPALPVCAKAVSSMRRA